MLEKQRLSKAQAAFEPSDAQQVSPKPSAWEIALEPTLFSVLCTFFMLNLINTAGSTVFILFAYTSIDSGGLSRSVGPHPPFVVHKHYVPDECHWS